MPTYRVRPGAKHGAFEKHAPGTLLTYTEEEARGFLDKVELVEDSAPRPEGPRRPTVSEAGLVVSPAPEQTFDIAEATVSEVLDAVEAGTISPVWALNQEQAGRGRVSLLRALERIIEGE